MYVCKKCGSVTKEKKQVCDLCGGRVVEEINQESVNEEKDDYQYEEPSLDDTDLNDEESTSISSLVTKLFLSALVVIISCSIIFTFINQVRKQGNNDYGASFQYTVNVNDEILIEKIVLDKDSTSINIPGRIKGKNVKRIGSNALENNKDVRKVTIARGVKEIGDKAFSGCVNLEEFELPDTICLIGKEAFLGCEKIGEIEGKIKYLNSWVIEANTTDEVVSFRDGTVGIIRNAFSGNEYIKEVILPSSLETVSNSCFFECINLESIDFKHVSQIEAYAFLGCTSIKSLVFPKGLNVIDNYAFFGCENIEEITFNDDFFIIADNSFKDVESIKKIFFCETKEKWELLDFVMFEDIEIVYSYNKE